VSLSSLQSEQVRTAYTQIYGSDADDFISFRALELVTDTTDEERSGLMRRRVTRLLGVAALETPLFFHLSDSSSGAFRAAVDQLADVGFEMVIYSFGSGFDFESTDPAYQQQVAQNVQYARSRGVEVGAYDLVCLDRDVGATWNQIGADGKYGGNACFASGWESWLLKQMESFMNVTGISMVETDGPYGGEACYATAHGGHANAAASMYYQNLFQSSMFSRFRALGVFINQPDNYFMQGGSKTGIGTRRAVTNSVAHHRLSLALTCLSARAALCLFVIQVTMRISILCRVGRT
jgi:hypothetical protein